jgi:hypothetical protein
MPEADHDSQSRLIVQLFLIHLKTKFPKHHEVAGGFIARWLMDALRHDTTPTPSQHDRATHNISSGDSKPLAGP